MGSLLVLAVEQIATALGGNVLNHGIVDRICQLKNENARLRSDLFDT